MNSAESPPKTVKLGQSQGQKQMQQHQSSKDTISPHGECAGGGGVQMNVVDLGNEQ